MKNKICLILIFLIFLLNIEAMSINLGSKSFDKIEKKVNSISKFVENGVRLEYDTERDRDYEINLLKSKIIQQYSDCCISSNNDDLSVDIESGNITVNFYKNAKKNKVEVSIINYDKKNNLSKLMKELTKLQGNNISNARYFKCLKGRINNTEDVINDFKGTKELKDIDTLNIHNGYVGTANLYDGERVNFTISSYDTGSYLIIGTPIIFTTY